MASCACTEARVLGVPDAHDLDRLARGLVIEGRRTQPADVRVLGGTAGKDFRDRSRRSPVRAVQSGQRSPSGVRQRRLDTTLPATTALQISVREGRNRQVRKMCDAIGHPIEHLKRVAIGPIRDDKLRPGQWRDLSAQEVTKLKRSAGDTDRIGVP